MRSTWTAQVFYIVNAKRNFSACPMYAVLQILHMVSSLDELDDYANEDDNAEAELKEDDELDENENMI